MNKEDQMKLLEDAKQLVQQQLNTDIEFDEVFFYPCANNRTLLSVLVKIEDDESYCRLTEDVTADNMAAIILNNYKNKS